MWTYSVILSSTRIKGGVLISRVKPVCGKCPKISYTIVANKMEYVNSEDPDQTAPKEQSDQGLHCLPFHLVL